MPTFTSPIKPFILAVALGFSQYGLAEEPNDCSDTFIVSVNVNNDNDNLTSFKEAWDFINTCPIEGNYTIQFHSVFNNSDEEPLLIANAPFVLDGDRTVTLNLDDVLNPSGAVHIKSSDATKNLFTIKDGSALGTQGVTIPTELVDCTSLDGSDTVNFIVDTLVNDQYDGQTSFNEAWTHANETCDLDVDENDERDNTEYSIVFPNSFTEQTIVLNGAPYKIKDGINISIAASETVILTAITANQAIFAQENNGALDSNFENRETEPNLVLNGESSSISFSKVTVLAEDVVCASEFTVDTSLIDPYDYEYSFQEVWSTISTECPGSTSYSINFNGNFNSQTLELANPPYTINDNRVVSISASTANPLTLTDLESSDENSSVHNNFFTVENGSQLTLKGLILDGSTETDRVDPAIISAGSDALLTLENVTLKGFHTSSDSKGSAISSSSPTVITNGVFDNNQAGEQGGAIRVSSADLSLTSTLFTENKTVSTGNNNTDTSGYSHAGGAAIAFVNHLDDEGNTLTIAKSTFSDNQAIGFGGAILIRGAKQVSISESTFTNNQSDLFSANGINQAYGGAIALDHQANVNIETSEFNGNGTQRSGGAIYVSSLNNAQGSLTLTDNSLVNNTATENGAAIYLDASQAFTANISRTSLNTNVAEGNGGGLYVNEKQLTLSMENVTMSANTANQGAGIFFENAVVEGSSINYSSLIENVSSTGAGAIQATNSPVVSLSHNIISGNTGSVRQVCIESTQSGFDISYSLLNEALVDDGCAAYMADGNSTVGVVDPQLGALTNNGGKGETHYPVYSDTSPVIDLGDATLEDAPDFDQRGSARISRGTIDIGAVEYGNLARGAREIPNTLLSPENEYSQLVTGFFTQPEDDTLSYSILGDLPDGLSFDSSTNTISGTPEYTGDGVIDFHNTITVNATQDIGTETTQSTFTITVGYSAPIYGGLTNLAVNINSGLDWDLAKSTDADNQEIIYTLSGLPEGLSFSENNRVAGRTTMAMVANSPYVLELQSKDEYDTTTTQLTLKVVDPDDVEIITDDSGAASLNPWQLAGLTLIGLTGFRRRQK